MINPKIGAPRPTGTGVDKARLSAANDLVQRTLAQHGLATATHAGLAHADLSSNPLKGWAPQRMDPSPKNQRSPVIQSPAGAQFRQETYTCPAGTRSYKTYIPSTAGEGITGIVVMLHGCTQNSDDFAYGTGMNILAEQHRFIVLYPEQSRGDNASSCWHWFSRADQQRDRGEPQILAGITQRAMAEFDVSREQTFVAGLSAGAAMSVILGETYPDIFNAIGVHSGLSYGSAIDVPSAFAAMAGNVQNGGVSAQSSAVMRTIVFHGTADATVHPSNGSRVAQDVLDRVASQTVHAEDKGDVDGRSFSRKITTNAGGVAQLEHWVIDGLGHAWSGGQSDGSYADPKGPDASAEMVRFFMDL